MCLLRKRNIRNELSTYIKGNKKGCTLYDYYNISISKKNTIY